MKLYDWLSIDKGGYNCCDSELAAIELSVTLGWIESPQTDYDFFVIGLMKKVDIIKKIDDYTLICEWSDLIRKNMSKFKDFTKEHWERDYKDEDHFLYQWIRELHSYVAGYVNDSFYSTLKDFVNSLI
ncbi:MAG: hypothetical protein IJV48_06490 [Ruminococcus sp.]|nr:hypothetical protein [Ruminococcus sp.]